MTPLETASALIGREIVYVDRSDDHPIYGRHPGKFRRFFRIMLADEQPPALTPGRTHYVTTRELRNLNSFRKLFDVPNATPAEKKAFLTALHNHCNLKETP